MFLEEIEDLKNRYPGRFVVHHVLSRESRGVDVLDVNGPSAQSRLLLGEILMPIVSPGHASLGTADVVQDRLDGKPATEATVNVNDTRDRMSDAELVAFIQGAIAGNLSGSLGSQEQDDPPLAH